MPWLDENREIITSDVFCISSRIKEIDPDYFIVRNHKTRKFEVHHKGQKGDTHCLDIPYPELDARTLERVRETRMERSEIIWEEIMRDAARREKEMDLSIQKAMDDEVAPKLKEIHRYVNNHESKETIPDDAYTTRFI